MEIDKAHYVKGYKETLKFPKKIIYYIGQILVYMGLALIPIFLIGQSSIQPERVKKKDRLLTYNLYTGSLIGIGGYLLILYFVYLITYYFDLENYGYMAYTVGAYSCLFIGPYYIILGMKRLYRLNKNRFVQISKLGYEKNSGVKESIYTQKLFHEKLESETEEQFNRRIGELNDNWHFVYVNEVGWRNSSDVANNYMRIDKWFKKLLIMFLSINFIIFVINYHILGAELTNNTVAKGFVTYSFRYVYFLELAISFVVIWNYWISRRFKQNGEYIINNIISLANIIIILITILAFSMSEIRANYKGVVYDDYMPQSSYSLPTKDEVSLEKSSYVQNIRHQRDYESYTSFEKTQNVMKHEKKFKKAIQKIGKDRVNSFGSIAFQSNNSLDKASSIISLHEKSITYYDGNSDEGTDADISISFYDEPQICEDESNGVKILVYGDNGYNNENLCGLEQDMVNTVESLYSEVFDEKILGIKSEYMSTEDLESQP